MTFFEKRGSSGCRPIIFFLLLFVWLAVWIEQPRVAQAQTNSDDEIIYIDGDGRIRVIDTNLTGPTLIDWQSPDGGYIDVAVGDFNADGDYEIVGIKGEAGGRELVVFDPVIVPDSMAGAQTTGNGVQWVELYRTTLGVRPTLIETGDFDLAIPGDEIVYGIQTGYRRSEIAILARDMSLATESVNIEARNWVLHTSSAQGGNFQRVWQHIATGQIDETGTDEIVLVDGTRSLTNGGIRSKIAAFRVDDGGLASVTPFFERENDETSWRYAEIAEMNGQSGAEIIATRSTANLLPNLFLFEYDMQRRTIRDLGDGCPDEPHEPLTCPDDVMSLRLSPSPKWTFAADVTGDGQEEAFFLRNVVNNQNPIRLFGLDFLETFSFDITDTFSATTTFNNNTTVYTVPNRLDISSLYPGLVTFSDGRMIARDESTTHWATYYDVAKLDDYPPTGGNAELYNLWQRGAGGDTDGDGVDEVVVMRTDNIRTYAFRPDQENKWLTLRNDEVATNRHGLKLANLDRNGTLRFANEFADAENVAFTFVSSPCAINSIANQTVPPIELMIDAAPSTNFQAFAMATQPAQAVAGAATSHVNLQAISRQSLPTAAPLVDWPSTVPWLKLSSGEQAPTTLVLEAVPANIPQTGLYHEAWVSILPVGLDSEFQRLFQVNFFCATGQLFLPIVFD